MTHNYFTEQHTEATRMGGYRFTLSGWHLEIASCGYFRRIARLLSAITATNEISAARCRPTCAARHIMFSQQSISDVMPSPSSNRATLVQCCCSTKTGGRLNLFSPTLFLIVTKWAYQSVQRHTGLTHPFIFIFFDIWALWRSVLWRSVVSARVPECQNIKIKVS